MVKNEENLCSLCCLHSKKKKKSKQEELGGVRCSGGWGSSKFQLAQLQSLQNVYESLYKFDFLKKNPFKQIDSITTKSNNISAEAQFLTADANRLTAENITSAALVVGQIFNETRRAEEQVKFKILALAW